VSTALIRGMTSAQAVDAVREAAVGAMEQGGSALGVWTEVGNSTVMIGLSRRGKHALVVEVDRAEFDGVKLGELLGLEFPAPRSVEALQVKAAVKAAVEAAAKPIHKTRRTRNLAIERNRIEL
jgi:hypothetical protein